MGDTPEPRQGDPCTPLVSWVELDLPDPAEGTTAQCLGTDPRQGRPVGVAVVAT